jgi:oligosaccharyltransferase complex subunit delta (ribophorin II)
VENLSVASNSGIEITFETTNDGLKGARAHQTVAVVHNPKSGLEFMFPATVKTNGRAKISIPHRSIPTALQSADPLQLFLLVGSFGADKPVKVPISSKLVVERTAEFSNPSRLGALPEITHTFRPPPKTVAVPVAILFALGAVTLLAVLVGFWFTNVKLGANGNTFFNAPLANIGLLVSLASFELVFAMYFLGSSIFDTLLYVALISPIAIISGSRALRVVGKRRLRRS